MKMEQHTPSIWRHLVAGAAAGLLLVVGAGGWAGTTEIAGAVVAPGVIVVDSNVKKVQHPTGGIVRELLVQMEITSRLVRLSFASTILRHEPTSQFSPSSSTNSWRDRRAKRQSEMALKRLSSRLN